MNRNVLRALDTRDFVRAAWYLRRHIFRTARRAAQVVLDAVREIGERLAPVFRDLASAVNLWLKDVRLPDHC